MTQAVRRVEYFRLWAEKFGDYGTWDTHFIEIPSDTPDDQLDAAIRETAAKIEWQKEPPVMVGVIRYSEEKASELAAAREILAALQSLTEPRWSKIPVRRRPAQAQTPPEPSDTTGD